MHPPPPTEAVLLSRARGGDLDAYEQLVRLHQQTAFRTALVLTRNAADAEEAAQDGFVKAWRTLGRFDAARPFRPWLLTIVANEARNRRRSAGRRAALVLRAAGEERPSGAAAPSPEAALLAGEPRAALMAALARSREDDRLVIGCRYLLELSEAETAAARGGEASARPAARRPSRRGPCRRADGGRPGRRRRRTARARRTPPPSARSRKAARPAAHPPVPRRACPGLRAG
ncbi:MAG: RNA polymerase sigma factor [Solirubrobacteraceae bacterium]